MADPQRGSAEDRRLRAAFRESERKREQLYKEWDRMLASGGSRLDAKQAELEAQLAANVQQEAEILAELNDEPDEPPAAPEPFGQKSLGPEAIFPSAEEAAAAAGPWSPEFAVWRRQHIPSSRGLL